MTFRASGEGGLAIAIRLFGAVIAIRMNPTQGNLPTPPAPVRRERKPRQWQLLHLARPGVVDRLGSMRRPGENRGARLTLMTSEPALAASRAIKLRGAQSEETSIIDRDADAQHLGGPGLSD